ncbi:protein phosphatase methylesterase 1 [Pieris rapae]|uniref:protein phosphatase methylesterase 1 n=1 Tax=Pieris rapae TaxID=64459 RepID=UPI000B92C609|nr:protein phosphatase methylesterase 1 [Pieris rapae]
MSALQKNIMKSNLPPRMPRTSGEAKLAPFSGGRKRNYAPVSWNQYFEKSVDLETESGSFRVYLSPEPDHPQRPRIITLHGGGYSGLSWALFTEEITNMIHCQVVSLDIRGHGETQAKNPNDLSIETLIKDVEQVIHKLYGDDELPPLILLGHSMGGAIAVRAAHLPAIEPYICGVAVIDVVEGTAMDALASMQSFLRGRPTHFKSLEHAIEWCVRSGQVRNVESARVSMPSQIVNCTTNQLAINEVDTYVSDDVTDEVGTCARADVILEEGEGEGDGFVSPTPVSGGAMKYRWRVDLSKTEQHWSGWFSGLSNSFLTTRAPRLLLLASVDGLDRELTVGQMQGKFQMQVLTRCGHAVHEDSPAEVARVLASFLLRHRLTSPTDEGENMHLASAPGC